MKKVIFFLAFSILSCCCLNAQERLELDGYVKGYEGKVKLIINFVKPDHEVDFENEQEFYMVDGKFRIEGQLSAPSLLSIRIRPEINEQDFDPRSFESAFIWVDNRRMTLHGEKGNFEYCVVRGYSRQDDKEKLNIYIKKRIEDRRSRIDSLSKLQSETAKEELRRLQSLSEVFYENKYRLDWSYQYPHSYVSVYNYSWFLKWIPEMVPKSNAITYYNSLGDSLKHSMPGQQIKNYIENIAVNKKLKVGDLPYEFTLPDSTGTLISLSSFKGQVVLLDFWASNCGPCRKEHSNYVKLYERFKPYGFEIFSVSQDKRKEQWTRAMVKDNVSWPSVLDEKMNTTKYMYLVSAIPQNYLINSDGIIIGENIKGKDLEKFLMKLFDLE